ncbi:hypothetical protein VPH35_122178 [Triticum aestivum]|uniref:Plant heme peroxidase family profile domain-containing protein n=1 Tax=Triticum turgidum subsp. durum TaxID=4567 RepID=A0A9R1BKX6_TRITD|nr:unnamed protein product [Triticum turgidum subsp. durum]
MVARAYNMEVWRAGRPKTDLNFLEIETGADAEFLVPEGIKTDEIKKMNKRPAIALVPRRKGVQCHGGQQRAAPASGDVPLLAKIFASKGLDLKDLVVFSGAHTLGTAHCPSFADRLYNSTGENDAYGVVDPSLDSEYADKLRLKCKSVDDRTMLSEMDPGSFKTFDTSYYRHVAKRRGLFRSDAALLFDNTTRDYVQRIATGKFDGEFFKDFSASMIKMGDVGVLTGAEGEIRKKCYAPN